jgi:hypothetical protein
MVEGVLEKRIIAQLIKKFLSFLWNLKIHYTRQQPF